MLAVCLGKGLRSRWQQEMISQKLNLGHTRGDSVSDGNIGDTSGITANIERHFYEFIIKLVVLTLLLQLFVPPMHCFALQVKSISQKKKVVVLLVELNISH